MQCESQVHHCRCLLVHGGASGTPATTWELLWCGWGVFLCSLERVLLCIAGPSHFLTFFSDFGSSPEPQCRVRVRYTTAGEQGSVRDARGHLGVAQEWLGSVSEQFRTGFVVYRKFSILISSRLLAGSMPRSEMPKYYFSHDTYTFSTIYVRKLYKNQLHTKNQLITLKNKIVVPIPLPEAVLKLLTVAA